MASLVVTLAVALSAVVAVVNTGSSSSQAHPKLGVYAGPDQKGVTAAAFFDHEMGQRSTVQLEFPPTDSWSQIEGQSWLIEPHRGHGQLEYSVPVAPDIAGASLTQCANGSYNSHWGRLARNLIRFGFPTAIVRPGWEFNGGWYKWSATANPGGFARCFRQVVTAMRAARGERFSFDWNVTVGLLERFAPERAWPGAQYVDYIGVDVYDTSYSHYAAGHAPTRSDRAATVSYLFNGDHGLHFWARFAAARHKQLALPEWGVTWMSDGHGGGDNAAFVAAIFRFMYNPANRVAYARYFNTADDSTNHAPTPRTRFPLARTAYRAWVAKE